MSFAAGVFCERKQYVSKGGKKTRKKTCWSTMRFNGPASKVVYPRLSAHTKCCPPWDPTSGPQFRLGEICGAQGFYWPAGCAGNTASANVRLYLFLFHLSTGTCPLHPWISPAQSHYRGIHSFFYYFIFYFFPSLWQRAEKRLWNLHSNIWFGVFVLFFVILLLKY